MKRSLYLLAALFVVPAAFISVMRRGSYLMVANQDALERFEAFFGLS